MQIITLYHLEMNGYFLCAKISINSCFFYFLRKPNVSIVYSLTEASLWLLVEKNIHTILVLESNCLLILTVCVTSD